VEIELKLFSTLPLDNLILLSILPFGTGYLLDEEDKPDENSLMFAMALIAADSRATIPTITYSN